MWRKGLKRVCGLPRDTHSFLLAQLCATIPITDELCRRSYNFINACLSSDCSLISFFVRQCIFYSRKASSLGKKRTLSLYTRYGGRTQDISFIRNNYINYMVTSNLPEDILQTAGLLCELCFFAWWFIYFCIVLSLVFLIKKIDIYIYIYIILFKSSPNAYIQYHRNTNAMCYAKKR